MGPAASLEGRLLGQDFAGKDGWRMYHGRRAPGFPQHPHRGFETVTIVRTGILDHSDSLGGAGRYGGGDVQWLTAGKGILHAEMFPLLDRENPNPLELFQIWLNLPAADKFAEPHYTMFWRESIPRLRSDGGRVEIALTAGDIRGVEAPSPPPRSWASRREADVAIWNIKLAPGASWTMPAAKPDSNRMLYFFSGRDLRIAGRAVPAYNAVQLRADADVELTAGAGDVELLLLQGRPIGEPVIQYGPFVMNTREEIRQAYDDYIATQFGGWPWPEDDHVHPRGEGRFARHADGRVERAVEQGVGSGE